MAGESWYSRQQREMGHPEQLTLQWSKCANGEWCLLEAVDTARIGGHGVFIVWRSGGDGSGAPAVLYVGSGDLRHEIGVRRRDPVLSATPNAYVTWATVDPRDVGGVAAYLYQQLRPLWGEVPSPVAQQPVNLPLRA
jgi:hypothetical protein